MESILLACCSWLCSLGILISAVIFLQGYAVEGWDALPFFALICAAGSWCVLGGIYWHQRLRTKFRDDVEDDDARRPRQQLVSGIVMILFLLAGSVFLVGGMYACAGVVQRAREMQGL